MNNAISEIKNTLEATNSRITEAEDRISELEEIKKSQYIMNNAISEIKNTLEATRELRAFFSCMAWRAIPGPLSKRKRPRADPQ